MHVTEAIHRWLQFFGASFYTWYVYIPLKHYENLNIKQKENPHVAGNEDKNEYRVFNIDLSTPRAIKIYNELENGTY